MNILGISAFYHDSASCLLKDGRIVAAAQEERFTRVRHDPAFPYNAIMSCLSQAGIEPSAIDMVVFYEKPLIKLERVLQNAVDFAPRGFVPFCRAMPSWFSEKLVLPRVLKRELRYDGPVRFASHHQAHAAAAFYPSPFEEAAILTTDGVGEWATGSIGVGKGSTLRLEREIRFPHSLGMLYSAFTEFLGFKVNSDEYKVMGLAPYGRPAFVNRILETIVKVDDDGGFELNLDWFDFQYGARTAGARFASLADCPPRQPESPLKQVHMDLARSIQEVTETILIRQTRYAKRITGMRHLCLAGGVALNCVANGKILTDGAFDDIWIQPAAGDAGGALGAALLGWYSTGATRESPTGDAMQGALLGPEFDESRMRAALEKAGLPYEQLDNGIYDGIAECLDAGQVVGRFCGRMEFGPRALGSRSILADARNPAMQRVVNEKIKFREGFRPFAPAVLEEHVNGWFELDRPSPYMLLVSQVAPERLLKIPQDEPDGLERLKIPRSTIPAVTHVDGSARIQTVSATSQPDFRRVIQAFHDRTDCPVVLNTSFNLRGQPIVCTPDEAVQTFLACDIDVLAAGPFMARKPADWVRQPLPRPRAFRRPRRIGELRRLGIETGVLFAIIGLLTWFLPTEPRVAISIAAWCFAAFGFTTGLAVPNAIRGLEGILDRVGRRANSFVGYILFGVVFALVLTPTAIIRRLGGKRPEKGGWHDWADESSDLDNMY